MRAKVLALISLTRMPLRRAASLFPPTAYTECPYVDLARTSAPRTNTSTEATVDSGMLFYL
jgi:hypothetical protein